MSHLLLRGKPVIGKDPMMLRDIQILDDEGTNLLEKFGDAQLTNIEVIAAPPYGRHPYDDNRRIWAKIEIKVVVQGIDFIVTLYPRSSEEGV